MNTTTLSTSGRGRRITASLLLFVMVLSLVLGGASIAKAEISLSDPFSFITTEGEEGNKTVRVDDSTIRTGGLEPVDTVAKVKTICNVIIAICVIAAVTSLVIAGVRISLSGGNDMARSKALKGFGYSLLGAAVIGGSTALFGFAYGFLNHV